MANQRLNIDIVARDKSKQALNNVRGALSKVKGAVFNLQNAFIGLGAGLVIRNLISTGKELENLQVRLKFLLKDTNEGAKAFENMTKFASKVPFSLEEIQSGAGILATAALPFGLLGLNNFFGKKRSTKRHHGRRHHKRSFRKSRK